MRARLRINFGLGWDLQEIETCKTFNYFVGGVEKEKKRNNKVFDGCMGNLGRIRYRWIDTFGSLILDMIYSGEMILGRFLYFN